MSGPFTIRYKLTTDKHWNEFPGSFNYEGARMRAQKIHDCLLDIDGYPRADVQILFMDEIVNVEYDNGVSTPTEPSAA